MDDFPKQARIENTNLCNAVCTMCPREQLERPKGTMGLPLFSRIVKELAASGTSELHLQGYGEPFLDKGIFDKIKYAKSVAMPYTFMVTNASLFNTESATKLLESGLDKLKISFYGVDTAEYEAVHKGLKYEDVKNNVKLLLDIKKKLGKKKPVISMKYIGKFSRFIKFASQWGLKTQISFARLHNYGYGRTFNAPDVKDKKRTCPMVNGSVLQVLWDGRVVPCCYDFDGKMILGDLTRETVAEVWHGKKYTRFRQIHADGEYGKLPICLNCDKLR